MIKTIFFVKFEKSIIKPASYSCRSLMKAAVN